MGAITQAKQEIKQAKQPANSFAALIKRCAPQLQAVMPKGFTPERLTQLAIATYKQIPDLKNCSTQSMLGCCLKCAETGLEPNDIMGNAYILPYYNSKTHCKEAQFILGKNGMLELVRRSGQVKTISTQCVYEGDEFDSWEDETGVHFTYRPNLDADHDDSKLRRVYLSCHLKDGGLVFLQMSKKEVDAVRERSKAGSSGPWKSDYAAMAEKTVIRRAFNRGLLPRSVEVAKAVTEDESTPVVLDEDGTRIFEDPLAPKPVEVPANVDAETGEIIDVN